nr:hypothetical protein [Tanacetum cinerariifolium]
VAAQPRGERRQCRFDCALDWPRELQLVLPTRNDLQDTHKQVDDVQVERGGAIYRIVGAQPLKQQAKYPSRKTSELIARIGPDGMSSTISQLSPKPQSRKKPRARLKALADMVWKVPRRENVSLSNIYHP